MNFLAHLLLSCGDEDLLVGNFLGDFTPNRDLARYPEAIQRGIRLHRVIDVYTDNHPAVRQGVGRLRSAHGKYASVLIDVFYDYILSQTWEDYGPAPLADFADATYDALLRHQHLMPPRLADRLRRMVAGNWLLQYRSLPGIDFTIRRLQERTSRPEFLEGAVETLAREESQLTEEFHQFFPEVTGHVAAFCAC
jgi:acyl carrier protein phosphodiesterase